MIWYGCMEDLVMRQWGLRGLREERDGGWRRGLGGCGGGVDRE